MLTLRKRLAKKVPDDMYDGIQRSIERNNYATTSEFLRAAIREKLEREQ